MEREKWFFLFERKCSWKTYGKSAPSETVYIKFAFDAYGWLSSILIDLVDADRQTIHLLGNSTLVGKIVKGYSFLEPITLRLMYYLFYTFLNKF